MMAWSPFGLDSACFRILLLIAPFVYTAPLSEQSTELEFYPVADSTGCYYNFQHYDEADRIITNEPCLNCTCHNRMLMCYLKVCPFIKALGENCKVEKRSDRCCPVITCPEVPVKLLSSSTTQSSTDVGHLDTYGCSIEGLFFSDGARVPSEPNKPCELCYCIRNKTACVMQECTLNIQGCLPVYQEGVCCPSRYNCDHPNLIEGPTTVPTTTPGLIFTTTMIPGKSSDCTYNNEIYGDGAMMLKEKPCEHCYCMKGDMVCAVTECAPTPLEKINCTALPPKEGECCPNTYECDHMTNAELTTESFYDSTTAPSQNLPNVTPSEDMKTEYTTMSGGAEEQSTPQRGHISQSEGTDKPSLEQTTVIQPIEPELHTQNITDQSNQNTESQEEEKSTTQSEILSEVTKSPYDTEAVTEELSSSETVTLGEITATSYRKIQPPETTEQIATTLDTKSNITDGSTTEHSPRLDENMTEPISIVTVLPVKEDVTMTNIESLQTTTKPDTAVTIESQTQKEESSTKARFPEHTELPTEKPELQEASTQKYESGDDATNIPHSTPKFEESSKKESSTSIESIVPTSSTDDHIDTAETTSVVPNLSTVIPDKEHPEIIYGTEREKVPIPSEDHVTEHSSPTTKLPADIGTTESPHMTVVYSEGSTIKPGHIEDHEHKDTDTSVTEDQTHIPDVDHHVTESVIIGETTEFVKETNMTIVDQRVTEPLFVEATTMSGKPSDIPIIDEHVTESIILEATTISGKQTDVPIVDQHITEPVIVEATTVADKQTDVPIVDQHITEPVILEVTTVAEKQTDVPIIDEHITEPVIVELTTVTGKQTDVSIIAQHITEPVIVEATTVADKYTGLPIVDQHITEPVIVEVTTIAEKQTDVPIIDQHITEPVIVELTTVAGKQTDVSIVEQHTTKPVYVEATTVVVGKETGVPLVDEHMTEHVIETTTGAGKQTDVPIVDQSTIEPVIVETTTVAEKQPDIPIVDQHMTDPIIVETTTISEKQTYSSIVDQHTTEPVSEKATSEPNKLTSENVVTDKPESENGIVKEEPSSQTEESKPSSEKPELIHHITTEGSAEISPEITSEHREDSTDSTEKFVPEISTIHKVSGENDIHSPSQTGIETSTEQPSATIVDDYSKTTVTDELGHKEVSESPTDVTSHEQTEQPTSEGIPKFEIQTTQSSTSKEAEREITSDIQEMEKPTENSVHSNLPTGSVIKESSSEEPSKHDLETTQTTSQTDQESTPKSASGSVEATISPLDETSNETGLNENINITKVSGVATEIPSTDEDDKDVEVSTTTRDNTDDEDIRIIPGEGSCLVDGKTYHNNTSVPPINHCQITCKCVSSILQCESVACDPPNSKLQNCMPVYQGPDSCCPSYNCAVPEEGQMESDSHKKEEVTTSGIVETTTLPLKIKEGSQPTTVENLPEYSTRPPLVDGSQQPEIEKSTEKDAATPVIVTTQSGIDVIHTSISSEENLTTKQTIENEELTTKASDLTSEDHSLTPEHPSEEESPVTTLKPIIEGVIDFGYKTHQPSETTTENEKLSSQPHIVVDETKPTTSSQTESPELPSGTTLNYISVTPKESDENHSTDSALGEVITTGVSKTNDERISTTVRLDHEKPGEAVTEPNVVTDHTTEGVSNGEFIPTTIAAKEVSENEEASSVIPQVVSHATQSHETTDENITEAPGTTVLSDKERLPEIFTVSPADSSDKEQTPEIILSTEDEKEKLSSEDHKTTQSHGTTDENVTEASGPVNVEAVTKTETGHGVDSDAHSSKHDQEVTTENEQVTPTLPIVHQPPGINESNTTHSYITTEKQDEQTESGSIERVTTVASDTSVTIEGHSGTNPPEETTPHPVISVTEVTVDILTTEQPGIEHSAPHEEDKLATTVITEFPLKVTSDSTVAPSEKSTEIQKTQTEPASTVSKIESTVGPHEVIPSENTSAQSVEDELITDRAETKQPPSDIIEKSTETNIATNTPARVTDGSGMPSPTYRPIAEIDDRTGSTSISTSPPLIHGTTPVDSDTEVTTKSGDESVTQTRDRIPGETHHDNATEENIDIITEVAVTISANMKPESDDHRQSTEDTVVTVGITEKPVATTEIISEMTHSPGIQYTIAPIDITPQTVSVDVTTIQQKPDGYTTSPKSEETTTSVSQSESETTESENKSSSGIPSETVNNNGLTKETDSPLKETAGTTTSSVKSDEITTRPNINLPETETHKGAPVSEYDTTPLPVQSSTPLGITELDDKPTSVPMIDSNTSSSLHLGEQQTTNKQGSESGTEDVKTTTTSLMENEHTTKSSDTEITYRVAVTESSTPSVEKTQEDNQSTEQSITDGGENGTTTAKILTTEKSTELPTTQGLPEIPHITQAPIVEEHDIETTVRNEIADNVSTESDQGLSTSKPLTDHETSKPITDDTAYTSPHIYTTTPEPEENVNNSLPDKGVELFTSGPELHYTTKKMVEGELSTSASVTLPPTLTPHTESSIPSTYLPPHEIHEENTPALPDYHDPNEDYGEEEQNAFGPGTCRYGGKVYVSAQQIPRDDPCDFCFCFRSDIICLQQSCPPPIPRCHEEPIRGFCCPRYECPVNMATSVNVTTPTTTTTTTLPPHFFSHAYKGRASKEGCLIRGRAYRVGQHIKSASGPCLDCKCGGNGQMKCEPKACSPEPMLRQMIEAATRRRR